MIRGKVVHHQAIVEIILSLKDRPSIAIEYVVDTGFEGALTLPIEAVEALGLPYLTDLNANLADDTNVSVKVHVATVIWDGTEKDVAVLAMGRRPLIGTALLDGCQMQADFVEDGLVTIRTLS
jgi:clan AA aspartic protease